MTGRDRNRFGSVPKEMHRDERGWVINPFDHLADPTAVTHCHAFSIEPGCRRGGHVHEGRDEQVAVLGGTVAIVDMETGHEAMMSPSSDRLLVIPPGVPHVFENRSGVTAVALCFSSGPDFSGDAGPRL